MPSSSDSIADWTAAWTEARALLLVTWTRAPSLLSDPTSRRLLELSLAVAACRDELRIHAHVVLPGALHVIGALPCRASWPRILGQVKANHARWNAQRQRRQRITTPTGPHWRSKVLVQPLGASDLPRAVHALHYLPVHEGLVTAPGEWETSSWHVSR